MRSNQQMADLLADADLTGLSVRDIPPMFREVVERGWSLTGSGARVLTDLRPDEDRSYFDRLAEETTVNGRGMTDWDLPAGAGKDRAEVLLRRSLAYIGACLRSAEKEFGDQQVLAYLSLSLGGTDDDLLTAHVTFCTPRPDTPPYVADLEQVRDAAVAEIAVEDCPDR
ncbi:hypothetical protein ABZ070_17930 [Streptomyces sp. NPDC006283]|uniref:hypothetical protein n=1 Tax=Streptomyces sp. NPDC006283 TaxID=3156741 RepID=UPI0033A5B729